MYRIAAGAGFVAGALFFAAAWAEAGYTPDQTEESVAYQINPAHTGSVTFAGGFAAPLKKLWTFDTKGAVTYPLVAGGQVFVVSNGNDVFALDALTGKRHWEHLLSGNDNLGAYDNGMLFFDNSDGQVTALIARSGRQAWGAQVSSDFSSSAPIALNGQLFVAGPALTALDESTGAIQWSNGIEATDGSAAFGNGGLYVGGPCQYYKYAPSSGKLLWHDSNGCEGGGGTSPAYYKGHVYLVDWAEGNFVLSAKTGAVSGNFPGSVPPSFYLGDTGKSRELVIADGKLVCLSLTTGNVVWSYSAGSDQLVGQPIAINGQPIVAASSGKIVMLDDKRGKVIWSDTVGNYVNSMNAGDGVLAISAGTKVTVFAPQ